jgi:beta-N-acetylhexosaminidase
MKTQSEFCTFNQRRIAVRNLKRSALALCLALILTLTGVGPTLTGAHPALTGVVTAEAATSRIDKMVKGMSLSEKVGQLFLADCPTDGRESAKNYQLGGYVLFARDFENQTPASVKKTIGGYQSVSKIPMLITVDEEGGSVTRISRYKAFRSSNFLSPQAVYKAGGASGIRADVREKAKLLKSLGVNVNLAPVADVPTSTKSYIYGRSFGTDPKLTSKYVDAVVKESRKAGLGSVLKHFPGYGDNGDTHKGIEVDSRPLSTFKKRDLLPFKAGIAAGAPAILVSHNIVTAFDAKRPASLSLSVHKLLRDDLKFNGVVMTDDLAMDAITEAYGQAEAAVLAVQSGNDMLITEDFKTGIDAVLQAVKSGRIKESRIDVSVRRILEWKKQLGLI